jgi:hypothetical protein
MDYDIKQFKMEIEVLKDLIIANNLDIEALDKLMRNSSSLSIIDGSE